MRLRALGFVLVALGATGYGAWRIGETAAAWIERDALTQARSGLAAAGETWAGVEADGLILTLTGAAPDEARRLAAESVLRQIVNPRRLRDATTLVAAAPDPEPAWTLELLRSGSQVSALGLAPAGARAALDKALAAEGLAAAPGEMIEEVARPAPAGWDPALALALDALDLLPRARISAAPGRVTVSAVAPDEAAAEAATARLRAAAPNGVALALDISAPRPTFAPFRYDFVLDAEGARLEACDVADSTEATRLGAAGTGDCRLGLGAPSPDWAAAAEAGTQAVQALGGGRFALTDFAAVLAAPEGADLAAVEAAATGLAAALPQGFSLRVDAPPPAPAEGPPRFEAGLAPDGALRITGPLRDQTSAEAVMRYAEALFGDGRVTAETVLDPTLPEGWPGRVLAALGALALMREGTAEVTAGLVALEGEARAADGEDQAAALLGSRAEGPAELSIRFDADKAAAEAEAAALAADPEGACLDATRAVLAERGIGFEPGSARISDDGLKAVAAIAAVLANCPPLDLEIAGHTDASGAAAANQALSENRALAVQAALEAIGLPQMRFLAHGYGAERPIADNDTEDGRARNRRIEFALIGRDETETGPDATPDPAPEPWEAPRIGPQ